MVNGAWPLPLVGSLYTGGLHKYGVTQTLQAGSTRTIALFSGGEHVPRASLPVRQHPAAVAERILHIEVGRSAEPSVDWFAHLGHSD